MTQNQWLGWAGGLALAYSAVCLWVFLNQRSLIYLPQPAADPSGRLELRVEGKRILVSHFPGPGATPVVQPGANPGSQPGAKPGTDAGGQALIYFGGNAEDVSLTRNMLATLLPDTALYLLHYRGYGGSEGSPSEAAIRADAQALYAFVAGLHSTVTVVGRSLGTGPAVHLAALQPVQRLVLLVPFDSLLAVARGAMPWLPVDLLLLDRWDAASEAPRVTAPTTIVAAPLDRVVPARHAEALYRAFQPGIAQLVLEQDLDHNTPLLDSPAIRRALRGGE